jgi:hypothetical protein
MNRLLAIVIPVGGLVTMGLYYGILPGGHRIHWTIGPLRSRGNDRFAVAIAAVFVILLIAGIVHAV